ncbi:hypothetical protein ACM258_00530 [Phaeobacter piscinae]|uniref:hypothetical protein n=1 Tax=Phaeobacter piscinae TaxID=1580596 RepID=UPI0039F6B0DF
MITPTPLSAACSIALARSSSLVEAVACASASEVPLTAKESATIKQIRNCDTSRRIRTTSEIVTISSPRPQNGENIKSLHGYMDEEAGIIAALQRLIATYASARYRKFSVPRETQGRDGADGRHRPPSTFWPDAETICALARSVSG